MADDASIPPDSCHTLIIGGGLGGLVSGCLLAQAGVDVCLFEMDKKPGGYLAGYRKKGFQFDTAIHWLNQCHESGLVRRLFNHIGPGSPATAQQTAIRRYLSGSSNYLLTSDPDQLQHQLIIDFPDEQIGIGKFFKVAKKLGKAFDGLTRYARYTTHMNIVEKMQHGLKSMPYGLQFLKYLRYDAEDGLALFFKDARLKKIFATDERFLSILVPIGWAYRGDFQNPPVGGSQHLPCWLAEQFKALGGKIFYRHKVGQILCEAGACTGVAWQARGKGGSLRVENVIAACDLETVYRKMLPEGVVPPAFLRKFSELKLYNSIVMLSIALSCPAKSLGFGEELIALSDPSVARQDQNCGDPHKACIDIISPTERDPSLAPEGCGSLIVCTSVLFSHADNWGLEKREDGTWRRTPAYKKLKQEYADILIGRLEKAMDIDLRRHILFCDVATPFTFQRYTGNKNGTIMGQRPETGNFKLKVTGNRTPLKNLYVSGHWADYGGGVPIAVKAGANGVLPILKEENLLAYGALCRTLDGKDI